MSTASSVRTSGPCVAAAAVLALAAWLVWSPVLDLALFGWDSYPLILAGRVRDAGELFGTFGEELMDGVYPLGHFYRPLTHLAFGFDHARAGLEPRAYHASDLFVLTAGAFALFLVARRLLGSASRWVPLAAALAYLVHPVQFEILPVPARRAEGMSVLFSLLALALQPLPSRPSAARAWLAALCCLAAVAAKETGAVAVGYVICLSFAAPVDGGWGRRTAAALRASWPSIALFALFVGARTAVLGGLGGSEETSLTANLGAAPDILHGYLAGLTGLGPAWARSAFLLALAGSVFVLARGPAARAGSTGARELSPGRVGLFLLHGVLVLALMTSLSGLERGWYALPFLPWLVLAAASCVHAARASWSGGARFSAGLGLALALVTWAQNARLVLARADLPAYQRASEEQADFLARFEAAVEAGAGRRVVVAGMPTERPVDPDDGGSARMHMLAPYSVSAYARLRFPDRRVRIEVAGRSGPAPAPDEVIVVLAP